MERARAKEILVGATAMPPDGLRVLFNLGDIGRDKATWTDPDEFRPERFLAGGEGEDVGPLPVPKEIRMMPFGAGHRHCPGVGMGMMLIKCFLAKLVGEFEWAPAAQDCSGGVDVTELNGFLKLMKKPLSGRFLLPKSFTSGDMAFSSGRKGL
jgi:cytochrome P450